MPLHVFFLFRSVLFSGSCPLRTYDLCFFFVSCSDFYSKLLFCCQGINLISYYIIEVGIHWKTL